MLDKKLNYFDKKAITATVNSDVVKTGKGDSIGNQLLLEVTVDADFVTANAATLQLKLQTSATEAFTVSEDVILTRVIAAADLKAGKRLLLIHLPYEMKEFTRVSAVVGTGAFTAGSVTANLVWSTYIR